MNTIKEIALFEPLVDVVPETQQITDECCIFVGMAGRCDEGTQHQHGEEGGSGLHRAHPIARAIFGVPACAGGVLRHLLPREGSFVLDGSQQSRDALETDGVLSAREDVGVLR